jgi:hypothetical protein
MHAALPLTMYEPVQAVGRQENMVGWYHSHPGYGCWLSGIDVGTQSIQQQYQEPFLAIVVDPHRTLAAGKVEIGAFRTYPEARARRSLPPPRDPASLGSSSVWHGHTVKPGMGTPSSQAAQSWLPWSVRDIHSSSSCFCAIKESGGSSTALHAGPAGKGKEHTRDRTTI